MGDITVPVFQDHRVPVKLNTAGYLVYVEPHFNTVSGVVVKTVYKIRQTGFRSQPQHCPLCELGQVHDLCLSHCFHLSKVLTS